MREEHIIKLVRYGRAVVEGSPLARLLSALEEREGDVLPGAEVTDRCLVVEVGLSEEGPPEPGWTTRLEPERASSPTTSGRRGR